jgi:hypothetical protein
MECQLLKRRVRYDSEFFGTIKFAVLSLRFDTKWNESKEYCMRYRAAEATLRWPHPIRVRLDFCQYREGGFLEPHIDGAHEHVSQVNFIFLLRRPVAGGELLSKRFLYKGKRLRVIRPTRDEHELTRVEKGERWVLNFKVAFSNDRTKQTPF